MRKLTKRQQEVFALSKKLKPLSMAAEMWAKDNALPKTGYYSKTGEVWCQCCGAQWQETQPMLAVSIGEGKTVCPECKRKLTLKYHPRKMRNEHRCYMTVATTMGEYQVLRVYYIVRYNCKGYYTILNIDEVFQNWIDGKGNLTTIARSYSRFFDSFKWKPFSDLEPKVYRPTGGYWTQNPYYIFGGLREEHAIYPGGKLTKTLRRNGMTLGLMNDMATELTDLCQVLISGKDPRVEELIKTGQIRVLDCWLRGQSYFAESPTKWIHAIRICNRNKYKVKDANLWFDHMRLLHHFKLDTHNAKYVCPKNLRQEHNLLLKRKAIEDKRERERKELERKRAEIERSKMLSDAFLRERSKFFGLAFHSDNLTVKPLQSIAEFAEEGEMMKHCVFSMGYYNMTTHPFSLILSARDDEGKRIETVEVNIKDGTIIQSRGKCNQSTPRHNEIIELVKSHMAEVLKVARQRNNKISV